MMNWWRMYRNTILNSYPKINYNGGAHQPPFFMSISTKVQEHIIAAQSELRSALYHSARNEQPATIQGLANILSELDKIATVADIMDHLEDLKAKHKGDDKGGLKWTDFEMWWDD